MTSTLDSILSGDGEALPNPGDNQTSAPETIDTQAQDTTEGQEREHETVPIKALHEERAKSKRYTEALSDVERRLEQQNTAWERRFSELVGTLRQPQQPQPDPADLIFSDPAAGVRSIVRPEMQAQQAQAEARHYALAREIAELRAGDPKEIQDAVSWFDSETARGSLHPADYHRVMSASNPFEAARDLKKASEITRDPAGYEQRMREKIMAELGQTPQQRQASGAVMPTNLNTARNVGARSGPTWNGPTPLADIFAR